MSDKSIRRLRAYDCKERYCTEQAKEYGKRKPYYLTASKVERCICCGDVIPEGRQVCPKCEQDAEQMQKGTEDGTS